VNLFTKQTSIINFAREFPRLILTGEKVRRKPFKTLSHGVAVKLKIGLLALPFRKGTSALVRGSPGNFSNESYPWERCLQISPLFGNPMSNPS